MPAPASPVLFTEPSLLPAVAASPVVASISSVKEPGHSTGCTVAVAWLLQQTNDSSGVLYWSSSCTGGIAKEPMQSSSPPAAPTVARLEPAASPSLHSSNARRGCESQASGLLLFLHPGDNPRIFAHFGWFCKAFGRWLETFCYLLSI